MPYVIFSFFCTTHSISELVLMWFWSCWKKGDIYFVDHLLQLCIVITQSWNRFLMCIVFFLLREFVCGCKVILKNRKNLVSSRLLHKDLWNWYKGLAATISHSIQIVFKYRLQCVQFAYTDGSFYLLRTLSLSLSLSLFLSLALSLSLSIPFFHSLLPPTHTHTFFKAPP